MQDRVRVVAKSQTGIGACSPTYRYSIQICDQGIWETVVVIRDDMAKAEHRAAILRRVIADAIEESRKEVANAE